MANNVTDLIEQLIKTIEDLFHHPNFESAANDIIDTASDVVGMIPEVMGDKHQLLQDAVGAAVTIAQDNILNK